MKYIADEIKKKAPCTETVDMKEKIPVEYGRKKMFFFYKYRLFWKILKNIYRIRSCKPPGVA